MALESGLWGLVPADVRELLRRQNLVLPQPAGGRRPGRHAARRAGTGSDFWDQRGYVAGDDPRTIDWRAVARRDRLVVQRTESQEDLRVVVALDQGGNMDYGQGSASKRTVAVGLTAALLGLAARQGDRVGLIRGLLDGVDATLAVPARGGERMAALADALGNDPRGRAPWSQILAELAARSPAGAIVVLVSDFLDGWDEDGEDPPGPELMRGCGLLRARGHEVVLLQVTHLDELAFPFAGDRLLRFEDLRGELPFVEGPGERMREAYLQRMGAHQNWLDEAAEREGLMRVVASTDEPPAQPFLRLLQRLGGAPVPDAEARP